MMLRNIIKKVFLNNWPLVLIIALSGLVVWPLFMPGYFSQHDNLQIIRIFEMRKCFTDFQIPCRWVPDMAYGNGYPLFNFYGVLPYYIGAAVSFVLGYIGAAKFLFFLPLVFGGVGMYILAKEIFGKVPGLVASVLFLFAPYRAVDSYVRGAVGESFGIALIPFVFFFILKLIKTGKREYFVLATISTFAFLVSHNIMTLIFVPLIIAWAVFWLWEEKWSGFRFVLLSLILAFGLSAFFIIPAFFEKDLVQTDTLIRGYYDFRNHFAAVFQLFTDRFWGYGGSVPGTGDQLSFQIGWPHWWLVIGAAIFVLFKKDKYRKLVLALLLVFAFSVFMIHNKSSFVWENIKILAYVQFPWRFLSVVIVSVSLLGAYFVSNFKGKLSYILAAIVVILTVALNWTYFKPVAFNFDLTDEKELTGQIWVDQQAGAVLDYLPKTALEPRELAPLSPLIIQGSGVIKNFVNKSNIWEFDAEITKDARIDVPVFDFPNWTVLIDNKVFPHSHNNVLGRIEINLPKGNYNVKGEFRDTPVRTYANFASILSLIPFLSYLIYGKNRKVFK